MNLNNRIITTIIAPKYDNMRIDIFLSSKFTYHSRNQWQNIIKQGDILLNNHKTKASRKLQTGEEISYIANIEEPSINKNWELIYEDEFFLLINKPPNLPSHPAGIFFKNTLWALLVEKYGKIYIINRLDRETSGLMIIGKTSDIARLFSKMGQNSQIKKKYYCLIHGIFPNEINAKGFIFNDLNSQVLKKRAYSHIKPTSLKYETAVTEFKLLKQSKTLSLVEAKLETGRLHQIRATLCSLNFPIVGDKLYGINDLFFLKFAQNALTKEDKQLLILNRQALQAYHLSFKHPITKKTMTFSLECEFSMLFC